jgi:uncharacterized protein (TIGR02118 family)
MIKTIGLLTRKDGWTHEQFMKHWVEIHAPLALVVPGLRRYVQNHIDGERMRPDIPTTEVEIDGIAELWFDDQAALETAARTPEMKALHADGALFIGRIKSYIVEEKVIVG